MSVCLSDVSWVRSERGVHGLGFWAAQRTARRRSGLGILGRVQRSCADFEESRAPDAGLLLEHQGTLVRLASPQDKEEGEAWVRELEAHGYNALTLEQRISVLCMLCHMVIDGPSVRAALEARVEEAGRIRKQMFEDAKVGCAWQRVQRREEDARACTGWEARAVSGQIGNKCPALNAR
jgi:hypothetical protein